MRSLGWMGSGLALASELLMTSDADIATLNAADARKNGDGLRGKGYNDPRLSAHNPSIADQAMAMGETTKIELGEASWPWT
ncbi:hypothetical protein, partial [Polaromonas sp. UC242_47]|uniref:hypothetical protein n=1 Tax=Polaromonas sp. UC242_47 TaxID=3374626 RepID=UPI0037C6080E